MIEMKGTKEMSFMSFVSFQMTKR